MIYTDSEIKKAREIMNDEIKALEEQLAHRDNIIKNLSSECSSLVGQLDEIRRWLKDGATVKATDINKPILENLDNGTIIGGCTITYPINELDEID